MDSAHVMLVFLGSMCTGQFIEKWVQRRRKLTMGEVSFLLFVPAIVAAVCMGVLEWVGFPEWYRGGEVLSGKDLGGSLGSIAAGCVSIWLVWGLFSAVRPKPKTDAIRRGQ